MTTRTVPFTAYKSAEADKPGELESWSGKFRWAEWARSDRWPAGM